MRHALTRATETKNGSMRVTQDVLELLDISLRIFTRFDRDLMPDHTQRFCLAFQSIRIRLVLALAPWAVGENHAKPLGSELLELIEPGLRRDAQSNIK